MNVIFKLLSKFTGLANANMIRTFDAWRVVPRPLTETSDSICSLRPMSPLDVSAAYTQSLAQIQNPAPCISPSTK